MKLAIRIAQRNEHDAATWRAWCPSLPGCSTSGQSYEEARQKIDEAIRGYIASLDAAPGVYEAQVISA